MFEFGLGHSSGISQSVGYGRCAVPASLAFHRSLVVVFHPDKLDLITIKFIIRENFRLSSYLKVLTQLLFCSLELHVYKSNDCL